MFRQRVILYLSAVTAMTIVAAIVGEAFLVQRVVEHSRQGDMRFASAVARHVSESIEDEQRYLTALLARLPFDRGEQALREHLGQTQEAIFEPGGISVFSDDTWAVGAERAPGGSPPRRMLLPTLRIARQTTGRGVTSMWRGSDGEPRVTVVAAVSGGGHWRAAAGNVRLDQRAFLARFGFFLNDPDVRLQILDATGTALFSTVPTERFRTAVHGTYLLDLVRQDRSSQIQCHACHEGAEGHSTREEEVSTLAPVPGTQWSVLLRENPTHMRQVLREMVGTVVALVCLIIGALAGFFWLLSRRVLQPLLQLASATAAITAATSGKPPPRSSGGTPYQPTPTQATPPPPSPEPAAPEPGKLREALRDNLGTAVRAFGAIDIVSAIIVRLEGESLGDRPLVVGSPDGAVEALAAVLGEVEPDGGWVTRDRLSGRGVEPRWAETLHRSELRSLGDVRGYVWVGTTDPEAARNLKPISVLMTLHLQGILDRSLLSDTLWHEHRQKSRLLEHLFEAEAEERKRIAREIHDDTAQALTALIILLETFPIGGARDAQVRAVATAQQRLSGIIDSTHRIMKRLRPALLDDLGLVDAVRSLGQEVLTGAGIQFNLDAPEEEIRAAPEIEDALFRVFQEAASNVVRHARASHVSATIALVDGQIVGSFEDDGQGLHTPVPVSTSDRPHFGLLGMRERVTQLGGRIRVSEAHGGGVRIDVTVPYRAAKRARQVDGGQPS